MKTLLLVIIGFFCGIVASASAQSSIVSLLEMRVGMVPGGTRVLPECGCTIRYLGTRVHGNDYDVMLRKLD